MGSGLILLLIVGAWLAVLVPMALRSSEAASVHSTVDRFHDAMRVLSRRDSTSRAPASPGGGTADDARVLPPVPSSVASPEPARPERPVAPSARRRTGLTPAARRRGAVGLLALLAVGSLVGGLLGPVWLLGVHAVADVLLLAVFLWLRHQAVLREERQWRTAMGDRRSSADAQPWSPLQELAPEPVPVAVYGFPDRMPARREIVSTDSVFDQYADAPARPRTAPAAVPAPAPRVPAARGAQGEPWQPVPVPVPVPAAAPRAPRRVVDLTQPAASGTEALTSAERSLGIDDQGPELEHILGRRAVGG